MILPIGYLTILATVVHYTFKTTNSLGFTLAAFLFPACAIAAISYASFHKQLEQEKRRVKGNTCPVTAAELDVEDAQRALERSRWESRLYNQPHLLEQAEAALEDAQKRLGRLIYTTHENLAG